MAAPRAERDTTRGPIASRRRPGVYPGPLVTADRFGWGCRHEAHRHPRRRLQRGVDARAGARPHPPRLRAADHRGPRQRRLQPGLHLPRRPRLPADRRHDLPLEIIRHPQNLGYGGNQKAGYRWAIEHDLDIVVLLHGDGQYAPELLPGDGRAARARRGRRGVRLADDDPGRRPRGRHAALQVRRQPDPHAGSRTRSAGTSLSEWHSGLPRVQRRRARASSRSSRTPTASTSTPRSSCSSLEAGKRIVEIPIPTYYGDEICYVNGMKYASDVTPDVLRYRPHKMGFGTGETAFATTRYELKDGDGHARTAGSSRGSAASRRGRVLDLGCSDGALGERLRLARPRGHGRRPREARRRGRARSTGSSRPTSTTASPTRWATATTSCSPPTCSSTCATRSAARDSAAAASRRGGTVVTSVPNFGHWYPRSRVAVGRFDYDRRGILDAGHLRFFTRRELRAAHRPRRLRGAPARGRRAAARGDRSGRRGTRRRRAAPGSWRASTGWPSRSGRRCSPTSSSTSSRRFPSSESSHRRVCGPRTRARAVRARTSSRSRRRPRAPR